MTNEMIRSAGLAAVVGLLAGTGVSSAAVLDFEGGLGYAAVDDTAISTSTFDAFNVSIVGDLSFEQTGGATAPALGSDPGEGFVTDNAVGGPVFDTDIDPDNDLDNFFLRQTVAFTPGSGPLFVINWLQDPTSTVSGEIWDIDGTAANRSEQWLISAIYSDGTVLSALSPEGVDNTSASLDGQAWEFSFDPTSGTVTNGALSSLEVSFVGLKSSSVGVAFDNFETGISPIPLPASGFLLLAALAGGPVLCRRSGSKRTA